MNAQTLYGIPSEAYRVDANGCWLWMRAADRWGYGRLKRAGKLWLAHRYAWFLAHGSIPDDLTIDHLCFVPACVNPEHMRLLTPRENSRNLRVAVSPTCRNGHLRTAENVRESVDRKGRSYRSCLTCERAAYRSNKPRMESAS